MSLTRDIDKLAAFHRSRRRRAWWLRNRRDIAIGVAIAVVTLLAPGVLIALQVWLP